MENGRTLSTLSSSSLPQSGTKIPVFTGGGGGIGQRRRSSTPNGEPSTSSHPLYFYACQKFGNKQKKFNHTINDIRYHHQQYQSLPETVRIHQNLHNRINHQQPRNPSPSSTWQPIPTFGSNSRATKDLINRSSLPSTPGSYTPIMADNIITTTVSSSSGSSSSSKNTDCKKKRNIYTEYLPLCQMQKGLQKGEIVEGILRINQRNYNDAYISAPDGGLDIFISGLIDRNKALNGDRVAVKLYPEDRWMISFTTINLHWNEWKNDLEKLIETVESEIDFEQLNLNSRDSNLLIQSTKALNSTGENKSISKETLLREEFPNLPVRLFGLKIGQFLSAIPYWKRFIQRTGLVVHILEQIHPRVFAGMIRFDNGEKNSNNANNNYLMLTSNDRRNPQIILPKNTIDPEVLRDSEKYRNYLFLVQITDWPIHSLYPRGKIIQSFGQCGDIEAETLVSLATLSIKTDDFPEEALQEYRERFPGKEWKIPKEEYDIRRDFRQECVFTIDPETAKDLDDAVSFRQLSDDRFEIGVHIADVSYFISEDTMLDRIAKERATSVYLVSRVIPMLPHLFCQDLCSLNPGEDKLTMSVVFICDSNGNIHDTWFGRTVINSCAKLTYEQAQKFIESTDFDTIEGDVFPKFHGQWTMNDVGERVRKLHGFASTLRRQRFETGSLKLKKRKLNFMLDSDGLPVALNNYETRDSNWLIEELMLLANKAAAEVLFIHFAKDDRAFLRGHPPMDSNVTQEFFKFMKNANIGVEFQMENTAALHRSLQELERLNENYFHMCTLYFIKSMKLAQYLCVSDRDDPSRYHHFALNFGKYTHFTSPIRRYADIIVHRLLATALNYQSSICNQSKLELQKIANNCNTRKYNAFLASEKSTEIYLKAYVRKIGSVICNGIVFQVFDHSFDVLLLDFSMMARVYVDQLWLEKSQFIRNKTGAVLKLFWKKDEEEKNIPSEKNKKQNSNTEKLEQIIKSFDQFDLEVRVTDKFDFKVIIAHPNGRFIQK